MNESLLKALAVVEREATQGMWTAEHSGIRCGDIPVVIDGSMTAENRAVIVAARNALPGLLADNARLLRVACLAAATVDNLCDHEDRRPKGQDRYYCVLCHQTVTDLNVGEKTRLRSALAAVRDLTGGAA